MPTTFGGEPLYKAYAGGS
ncbi:hypothetical protein [Staphylococcus aureus]